MRLTLHQIALSGQSLIAVSLFDRVVEFGGLGLLILGILDSSFLFAPWGNDLLMIAVTARHPQLPMMLYYAVMSTVGSVLGCLLIDMTLRPLGEKGMEKYLSARTLKRVEKRVKNKAGLSLAITSLLPPPFPFTAFVMVAAALQYARPKMLAIIGATRLFRFLILGFLAIRYGEAIIRWSKEPVVEKTLFWLIVICVVGSAWSVYGWVRRARS